MREARMSPNKTVVKNYDDPNVEDDLKREIDLILAEEGLFASNPEKQEGLIARIPEGIKPLSPINAYNTKRYSGEKVTCAACGHTKNHYKGLTVILTDQSMALVGHCCGEKHFGTDVWNKIHNELMSKQERVVYSSKIRPLRLKIRETINVLHAWLPLAMEIDEHFLALRKAFPTLMAQARLAARATRGELTILRRVQVNIVDELGRQKSKMDDRADSFGVVPARQMFLEIRISSQLKDANKKLELIDRDLTDAAMKPSVVRESLNEVRYIKKSLLDTASQHEQASEILDQERLKRFLAWARENTNIEEAVSFKSSHIAGRSDLKTVRVKIPKKFPELPRLVLEILTDD